MIKLTEVIYLEMCPYYRGFNISERIMVLGLVIYQYQVGLKPLLYVLIAFLTFLKNFFSKLNDNIANPIPTPANFKFGSLAVRALPS